MRNINIDLSQNRFTSFGKIFAGYAGEHLQSNLIIKIPNELIFANQTVTYKIAFGTSYGEKIIYIGDYDSSEQKVSCKLQQDITIKGLLIAQVEAYIQNEDNQITCIGKSELVPLLIKEDVEGQISDHTDIDIDATTLEQLWKAINGKQDKEDGKGLSSNDYTTAEKDKLASVESGANKTVVDDEISEESENPVQNKVLASILCDKTDKEYVDNYAEKKMGTSTVLNNPLTANCNYFFTVDDNFILSFPTEDLTRGDTIYLNFECSTDVTLIVDTSNTTAIDIIPEANKGYEVFGCWNGNKWVLGYDEYDLPVTTIE